MPKQIVSIMSKINEIITKTNSSAVREFTNDLLTLVALRSRVSEEFSSGSLKKLVNTPDGEGRTLLHILSETNELYNFKAALTLGINPYSVDRLGQTYLMKAVSKSSHDIIKYAIEISDLEFLTVKDEEGYNLYHFCAKSDYWLLIKELYQKGIPGIDEWSNGKMGTRCTPLQLATLNDSANAAKALIELGANKDLKFVDGQSMFTKAFELENNLTLAVLQNIQAKEVVHSNSFSESVAREIGIIFTERKQFKNVRNLVTLKDGFYRSNLNRLIENGTTRLVPPPSAFENATESLFSCEKENKPKVDNSATQTAQLDNFPTQTFE